MMAKCHLVTWVGCRGKERRLGQNYNTDQYQFIHFNNYTIVK